MNRLRLIYVALVITVLILIAFAGFSGIYQAITRPNESATITTQAMVDAENFSVFHYDIINKEGRDTNYKICTDFEDAVTCFWQPIEDGKAFTYKRYFQEEENRKRKLTITVYKEDDPEPIENATYYI
jgi:hypothetical protein